MDLKDKIVGLALVALISLVGWNLKTTWEMKEQVFKLQQGQEVLSQQIKKNTNFVKRNIKKQNKKKKGSIGLSVSSNWFPLVLLGRCAG